MNTLADVMIVTVTEIETHAVLDIFSKNTGNPAINKTIGDRVYRDLGKINGAKVFHAFSEMGAVGPGAALLSVQKGIDALKPKAVIMVGIAFGCDEGKQQIGDILVSSHLMQYESQRVDGKGDITARGDKPRSSPKLLHYLKSAKFNWKGPNIHVGTLLTGEKLVDNLHYRESLKKLAPEAIGGEMEGTGLYAACVEMHVDWIMCKAICDWADGNKGQDKEARQKLAAHNAVSFVLHTLLHAPLPCIVDPGKLPPLNDYIYQDITEDLRKYIEDRSHLIYQLEATDADEQAAQYFLFLEPEQEHKLRLALSGKSDIDIKNFGELLASCYGADPSERVKLFLNSKFKVLT